MLNRERIKNVLLCAAAMGIVGCTMWLLSLKQAAMFCDLFEHLGFAKEMWAGERTITYPGWYTLLKFFAVTLRMSDNIAAASTNCVFVLLCGGVIYWLSDILGEMAPWKKCAIVLFMSFFGPLHFSQFGGRYYIGQGTFNTWHSPTNTCVKFAAILVFVLFAVYFQMRQKDDVFVYGSVRWNRRQLGLILCVATFVSLLLKPSFFQVMAPTVVVILAADLIVNRRSLKEYIIAGLPFVPAGLLIVYQTIESLLSPTAIEAGGGMEIAVLEVWRSMSGNVMLSILSVIIFPCFVAVFCRNKEKTYKLLPYAFVFYGISVLEAALLSESGGRKFHGNFFWGMNLAIGILFFAAIITFVKYVRQTETPGAKLKKYVGLALLAAHFAWGVWYYIQLLLVTTAQCF